MKSFSKEAYLVILVSRSWNLVFFTLLVFRTFAALVILQLKFLGAAINATKLK